MVRARGLLLFVATACGDSATPAGLPDAAPRTLSIDVMVRTQSMAIRANETDLTCECVETDHHFPPVDTCVAYDDVRYCCGLEMSCLTARLFGTGVDMTAPAMADQWFTLSAPMPDDLVLELGGCGHAAPTQIPIERFTPPEPTLTATQSPTEIVATWQTSIPSATAIVTFAHWLGADSCHTTASTHTFSWAFGTPPMSRVAVTTYLPVIEIESPLGPVRLWRGASTQVPLDSP